MKSKKDIEQLEALRMFLVQLSSRKEVVKMIGKNKTIRNVANSLGEWADNWIEHVSGELDEAQATNNVDSST